MGARMSPAIKAMRQPLSLFPGSSRPPKMPLMPAMRPVNSISSTAEMPIKPPPIAADIGVKLAMTLLPGFQSTIADAVGSDYSQARHAQSQGIAHNAHRRQRHGGGGNDRREQETEMGIEDARGNRDAGVGRGKRRGVVDAVPGHGNDPRGLLQLRNYRAFLIRKNFRLDIGDPELAGDGVRRGPVVASQHDNLDAFRRQRL